MRMCIDKIEEKKRKTEVEKNIAHKILNGNYCPKIHYKNNNCVHACVSMIRLNGLYVTVKTIPNVLATILIKFNNFHFFIMFIRTDARCYLPLLLVLCVCVCTQTVFCVKINFYNRKI